MLTLKDKAPRMFKAALSDPTNSCLIMGLAWGASHSLDLHRWVIIVSFSFSMINLSSVIATQVNNIFDYELDLKDDRKRQLVQAMDSFGRKRLEALLIIEFIFTLILVSLFTLVQGKPILLLMWIVGIFLGYAYSAPPFRLKARSWAAAVTLILVLAAFPMLFAYYCFTFEMNPFFLLALSGVALTVYGVIIPTEIRDYFGDKAMGVETLTVRLGLAQASFVGILFLITGAMFTGAAFFLEWYFRQCSWLSVFLLVILVAVLIVLRKFSKLYSLSKEYVSSESQNSIAEDIGSLSTHSPGWIMLIIQTHNFLSIILLTSKFLL